MARRIRFLRRFMGPPRFTTEGESGLVGASLDVLKDGYIERLRQGLLARFPQSAPGDALPQIGRDRRVVRGLNETDESYAARLIAWLDDRKIAGNPFALMQKLAEYTGPLCSFRTVDARGNWFSRAADGTKTVALKRANWDWDGVPVAERWARFWVIIYPNGLWTEGPGWGDVDAPTWGDPGITWGSTATPEQVDTIRFIVADWKPAGTRCVNVILAFDGASFDPLSVLHATGMPDGLWEHWSKNVGGVQVPARLSTARYWDGVS